MALRKTNLSGANFSKSDLSGAIFRETNLSSQHTQRACCEDVMSFVRFLGIEWPQNSVAMPASINDVQAFRDLMLESNRAPKTINRRIASLSSFYKYRFRSR